MTHENRARTLSQLFFPFSEMLRRLADDLPPPDKKEALRLLKEFRETIEGDRLESADSLAKKWTPAACARNFAPYVSLLEKLGAALPMLAKAASDLKIYLSLQTNDTPDDCKALDRILEANVSGIWFEFASAYWERHRGQVQKSNRMTSTLELRRSFLAARIRDTYSFSRSLADNNEVLGAIVEETLREIISSVVAPLAVSTGSFYGPARMKQIDVIIWDRGHGPAAVEVGSVAVVPPSAVRGMIEIKASCDSTLAAFGIRLTELDAELSTIKDVIDTNVHTPGAMGVIIWSEYSAAEVLVRTGGRGCILFQRSSDGTTLTLNPDQLDNFLKFLQGITGAYTGSVS